MKQSFKNVFSVKNQSLVLTSPLFQFVMRPNKPCMQNWDEYCKIHSALMGFYMNTKYTKSFRWKKQIITKCSLQKRHNVYLHELLEILQCLTLADPVEGFFKPCNLLCCREVQIQVICNISQLIFQILTGHFLTTVQYFRM